MEMHINDKSAQEEKITPQQMIPEMLRRFNAAPHGTTAWMGFEGQAEAGLSEASAPLWFKLGKYPNYIYCKKLS